MKPVGRRSGMSRWIAGPAAVLFILALAALAGLFPPFSALPSPVLALAGDFVNYLPVISGPPAFQDPVVLAWNDLGMHCYNRDFQNLAILPPANTLWVQVVKRGNPPQILTSEVEVSYRFPLNTYSVGKSNFWSYEDQLFGVELAPDTGLTGTGLAGEMDQTGDHFVAELIPLTEFNDNDLTHPQPYQMAEITVKNLDGTVLSTNEVVAPVSTEMHCEYCHFDGMEGISTGSIEQNILTLHDEKNASEYPSGHTGLLMDRRPVLCAECHASNALGAPGVAGLPSLSNAMHEMHAGKSPDSLAGCYNCHPGPVTRCYRDVMSTLGMDCIDCHGGMEQVSKNTNPWLKEPRCDNAACHGSAYAQDQPLYRQSKGHGGIYCAACHDSPHAIAPSTQPRDGIKFANLLSGAGPVENCLVCHLSPPSGDSPHP